MMLVLLKNLIVVNFFIVSFHPETSEIPSPWGRVRVGVKNQGLFSYLSIPPPLNPLPPGEGKEYFRMDTSYMLLFQVRRALLSPVLRFAR
jgi:hypothetical protein